ncbi:MAG TPA: TatD family hydrolase [Candidatus Limnocylindria bacterium]|jgi:TatD DNase family protein|nr:TatD family hydrolase [Candidatus Limnocylindria bacterium]
MVELYDTHAHLDFPDFKGEEAALVERALAAGVRKIVTIGTTLESSARAIELASRFEPVYAAVGVHPGYADRSPSEIRSALRELVKQPKVVAIGEIGLDFYQRPNAPEVTPEKAAANRIRQIDLFTQQLEIAAEMGLNVVIHTRDSFADTMDIFRPYAGKVRGVFHCFVSSPQEAAQVIQLGSLVSFTGILTFKNALNVREALVSVPDGSFMFETDAPFLAPVPYRGKRCEPAFVKETAICAAELRGTSFDDVAAQSTNTARSFFRGL